MSTFFRRRIEATIEHLISVLDDMDGDPDLEDEPIEEEHDVEAERQGEAGPYRATVSFVLAETTRRYRRTYR